MFFTNPEGSVKGSISCLRVSGGAGYFVATAEESSNPNIPVGGMSGINVYDSGQPNGVGDKVLGSPAASSACQDPSGIGDPLDSGDIVVGTVPISGDGSAPHPKGHHKGHRKGHNNKHHKGHHPKHQGGGGGISQSSGSG